jgi:hypothetical protein
MPAASIVEGEIVEDKNLPQTPAEAQAKPRKKRSGRQNPQKPSVSSSNGKIQAAAIDWKQDPSKLGAPQQDWTTATKSIWLLYVVSQEASILELTGGEIAATFNKHFRQSGEIKTGQVNRDLGQLKGLKGQPALVAEDTTKTPSAWSLTQEGERRALDLVAEALGQSRNN